MESFEQSVVVQFNGASPPNGTKIEEEAPTRSHLKMRGIALDILRRVFLAEPERGYLAICQDSSLYSVFPILDESDECAQGMQALADYFSKHDPLKREADFEELHWDYTRLFVGPSMPQAPLWASFYLEPEKILFQQTTLDVRNLYRKHGLLFNGNVNEEADDHLGLELDFLYHLNTHMLHTPNRNCNQSEPNSQLAEAALQRTSLVELCHDQRTFIEDHVNRFVPKFAELVATHAATTFYPGFAQILSGFLKADARWLKELEEIEQSKHHAGAWEE